MENHMKKKKIQMDYQQCTEHSATEDGAQPLTNPECVRKSSKDVNRGLYPQPSFKGQRDMQPELYKTSMPQSTGAKIYSSPQSVHKFKTSSEQNLHTSEMSSPKRKLPEEFTSLAKLKMISPLKSSKASFSSSQLSSKCGYGSQHNAWRSSEDASRSAPGCSKMTMATNCDASTSGCGSRESVQPACRNLFNNESALGVPSESNDPNLLAFDEDSTDEELMIRASVEAEKGCSTSSRDTNLEAFENDSFLDELSPTMLENMETEEANTYGLLGGSSNVDNADETGEDENVEYLTCLPDEILEKIFSYLSISVCCHICVVCKRWSRIILNHKFLPWKKLYQRYKYSEESGVSAVRDIYTSQSFGNHKSCLLTLIRYMSEFKTIDQSATVGYMSRHPMFQVSCDLLAERAPDLVVEGVPNLWSLLATIVILSRSTHDISEAIKYSLQSPWQHSTVIESFYCIATMLLMLQNEHSINCGLYHALYHYESGSSLAYSTSRMIIQVSSKDSLKMQKSGHVMTQEQVAIVSYKLKPKEVVKIIAFAGTGKTSTLINFTLRNPNMTFLYVAFNKSVEEQAKRSFPSNVQCRTTHSLAYGAVGYRYKKKLIPNLKIYNVVCMLEPKATSFQKKNTSLYVRAKLIIKTIKNFMASDDANMMLIHVPEKEKEEGIRGPSRRINPERRKSLLMDAKKLWERMRNPSDREASVTHDAYLKLFQLTEASLPSVDCILIDEAQDLTPAQKDILMRPDCAKIVVGDPHQQIYSFRGATNALRNIPATKTFHLTQSFRFGPEIAYVANCVLHALKNVKKYVIGIEALGSVLGEEVGQVAVICRTNLSLFNEVAKLCEQNKTVTIGFVGGVRGYRFDQILDIYKLFSFSGSDKSKLKNEIEDKFIQCYSSISQLESYADDVEDVDLLGRIQIVKTHHIKIPEHIDRIRSRAIDDITQAEVVFTTAHKAKGLEFDTVKVTCDFLTETSVGNLPGFGGIPVRLQVNQPMDEFNLLYVALTRAKKRLKLTSPILKLLARLNETFSYPVSTKAVSRNEDGALVRCFQCSAEIESNRVLAFERLKVNLGYSTQAFRPPGFLCSRCAGAENVGFSSLV